MRDLSQKTINKIKEEQIKPKAKWKFLAEDLLIWSTLAFIVIFGALSFSIAYFFLTQLDWDVISFGWHMPFGMFFWLMPNFWILLLVVFLIGAIIIYRHTKHGYRSGTLTVIILALVFFSALGFATHLFKADRGLNNAFSNHIPGYVQLAGNKEKQWSQPNLGLLGGKILQVEEDGFELEDFQGEEWKVNVNQDTVIKPSAQLVPEETVKVIGKKESEKNFQAEEIRPWEGKGIMHGKNGGNRGSER